MKLLKIIAYLLAVYILLIIISSLFVNKRKEYLSDSKFYRWILNSATSIIVFLFRIHIEVSGLEMIPQERFLLVSNHRSCYDPILTWYVLKDKQLSFISKEANFSIPAFGRIIYRCCFLPIDRENPRNALVTINTAASLISSGSVSMGVYPEGRRSKECILLPFHAGVFKIAQKAHCPIIIMSISGTEKIFRNLLRLRKSQVNINFLKVISPDESKSINSQVICADAFACISQSLDEI